MHHQPLLHQPIRAWRRLTSAVTDFWFESPCVLCQRSTDRVLCSACQRQVQCCQLSRSRQYAQLDDGLSLFSWGHYGGSLRQLIACLKYDNQPQLGTLLGQWLGQTWLRAGILQKTQPQFGLPRTPVVMPIPLHPDKLQLRGYNQAHLVANQFCHVTKLQYVQHGLGRVRATQPQFSLSAEARSQNVANAFQVSPILARYRRHPIWLLDDIYTTGATARSAAQTLQQQGFIVQGVIAVAKTQTVEHGTK